MVEVLTNSGIAQSVYRVEFIGRGMQLEFSGDLYHSRYED